MIICQELERFCEHVRFERLLNGCLLFEGLELLGRLKTSKNIFLISIMIVQKGIISFNIVLQFSYAGIILSVCGCPDLPIGDVAYD